ncbi:hypothetical protein UFB30_03920 [Jeotgalibacillus sp. HH7-29]|uniref:Uncharacterized protein n=1 Tax=Jeotgalibacillus haloalkalitolerans TaxID=3104292 RepID=A0ABU5KJB3_9BACL|nr:hypothetical protein [Jeotgalibacillus sp. HH7-29]
MQKLRQEKEADAASHEEEPDIAVENRPDPQQTTERNEVELNATCLD